MNKKLNALYLVMGTFFAPQVFATLDPLPEWGTAAVVVSSSCSSDNNCSIIDQITGFTVEDATNGFNMSTSSAIAPASSTRGTARSFASITEGVLATPELKAEARSNTKTWISAAAFANQGYTYSGSPQTLIFDIGFDGTVTNEDSDSLTGFIVGMYLFTQAQAESASLTLSNALPDSSFLPTTQVYELNTTPGGSDIEVKETGQISISLVDGDQFYLAGGVFASALGINAVADAFGTLTVDLVTPLEGTLTAASVTSVPLPAAAWMFMSALLGLAGVRKSNTMHKA